MSLIKNVQFMIIVLLFVSVTSATKEKKVQPVDTTFIVTTELNGDDIPDTILYTLTAESWDKPMTVSYTIKCLGETILTETTSDENIDQDFGNPSAMDDCDDYITCKKRWYLHTLSKDIVRTFNLGEKNRTSFFDMKSDMSLISLAQRYYKEDLQYSEEKSSLELKKLITFLKKNDIVFLIIPGQPIYKSFPRFYDPIQKKFIQVYGF